ncbi:MAG: PASTA domain-containing protein [Salinivirgaceae bacterium]|nr:PASTA domain-containing protein [Salinivirgaceae bacterium]
MGLFALVKKKRFWKNVLYAAGLYVLFYILTVITLRIYTHHGKSFPVPDFKGLKADRVEQLAEYNNLHIEIIDSNYVGYLPKGSIIDQYPRPGINVKKDRTIFLTINAFSQAKVEMPNVVGMSFRQGKNTIESRGLVVGKLIYRPDFAKNNILEQRFNGNKIDPGVMIEKGQNVDIVLGNGLGKSTNALPNLADFYYKSAVNQINNAFFNVGNVYFDTTIHDHRDTLNARVYKQKPPFYNGARAIMGAKLDIWLSLNPDKFPKADTTQTFN